MPNVRVALQITCVNDAMFPETGKAVVRLLRRLGVDVDFPAAQTCCGQPMVNTGYLDEAVPVVRTFVDALAGYDAVVTPSGSCAGTARHQHAIVASRSGDPALVAAVAETAPRTHELSEFLVDVLGVTDVGAYFPHRVTYHPTCHSLRMLGVGNRPSRLLEAVRGKDDGAVGLSSGLYYAPGSYSKTSEVIAMAKATAPYGGVYSSHIRDESDYTIGVVAAVQEVIDIAEQGGVIGVVSHMKALGPASWGLSTKLIDNIDAWAAGKPQHLVT